MTPERWLSVREILAEALELKVEDRAQFLDRICSSDQSLRNEVERLLSSSDAIGSTFLQSSAQLLSISPGTKLGEYEVVKLLGSGGMGEVYRARDTRLRRDVAIKVIPSALLNDPERLHRFEQEARAAASLNHPNILAVFQMGTFEGFPYLVSELLDGSTLREELLRGPVSGRKAVDYGVQIARGLAVAHDHGIVHRDLKPENLFLTKDGRVKILDFGLAKLTQPRLPDAGTVTKGTEPGLVMGTVGYMSPEQVGGKPVDHRTDIFAFGTVLYETVTGKRAFQKPTAAETMSAILNEEPPDVSHLALATSPALQKIVQRCLEKNPAQRFQSASDLAFALEALSDSGASSTVVPAATASRWQHWSFGLVAAALVLFVVVGIFLSHSRSSIVPPTEWEQITDFADSATSPTVSPDGRMLAFLRGDGTFVTAGQIYVMLLPHGTPVRLTSDDVSKMSPIFSPDGSNIAYTVPWDTWTVPVLGGTPQLWLPNASGLTWLGSDNLMFSQITTGNHMELVSSDLSRAHVHTIYSPDIMGMVHRSYLSPDRKWVIAVEMGGNVWDRCRLVPFDGSTAGNPIGPADGICTSAAWSPYGKWMYLNSNSGHAFHIWRQRFPNGKIEQITSGPTQEEGIAIAPDGKYMITSVGMSRTGVWLHDSHGDRVLTSEATATLADPRSGSPFSPDGKTFYYFVRRTPGREVNPEMSVGELWGLNLETGETKAVLPGFSVTDFSISPDGRNIAFSAMDDSGVQNLWVGPVDRRSSPRILKNAANRSHFTSEFIYYIKRDPTGGYVHRIRPDGTDDQQIWDQKVLALATSPDGTHLAVTIPLAGEVNEWTLEIVDWRNRRVQPVCNDCMSYWSNDGRSLIVFSGIGKISKSTPTYVISLPAGAYVPNLPAKGVQEFSQIATLPYVRTIPKRVIAAGSDPDTYAYVKETVQRNLYRIPLH